MTTHRERRAARAERLRDWADKREAKADTLHEQARAKADMIPFGQPILVGHYSEGRDRRYRDSIARGFDKSYEHQKKADEMRAKAANIDAAAERAIYSDDPDAVERLEAKLADLEAQRARIKAYNASCRKGTPDRSLLSEAQVADLESCLKFAAFQCKGEAFPPYALSNLSGTINATRKRLEGMGR